MTATCHGSGAPGPAAVDARRILLVGNPNVGKSTLFNAMTGARQRVMNAPGTTVELSEGSWRSGSATGDITVTDLPGTYSLIARSPDEQVVADAVLTAPDLARERAAVAVVLLDATALARSLYLLAQVARSGRPVVVAVTMHDVARARGQAPDLERLAEVLAVPVIPLDPRTGTGLDLLAAALADAGRVTVPGPGPGGDALTDHLAEAEPLFDWVEGVLTRLDPPPPPHRTRSDAADRVLLNPWIGLPVFAATMWALFQLGTSVAAPLMDLVDRLVNGPVAGAVRALLDPWAPPLVEGLVVDGVLAGVGTVLTFLPLMALMYTALALLEDSGYLARSALLADRLMRALGLDGRAVLPLIIGFGCNVPALAATRTLPSARQRLLTGLLVPWTTCAARLTVYILLAGVFFPRHAGTVIFAMYAASVVLVVGGGWVLRRTFFRDVIPEPLLLVLPAYQRPRSRAVAASVWSRVSAFAMRAGKIIVVTLTVVWALMALPATGGTVGDVPVADSLYGAAAHGVAPVFEPAGFGTWHAAAALATGFVAKEVVVGALAQSYAVAEPSDPARAGSLGQAMRESFEESSGGHGGAAALAFMVFVLAYTPCLATVAEQWRLFGARWTLGAMGAQILIAWLAAVTVFQVGKLL